jgi:hypothetical protein
MGRNQAGKTALKAADKAVAALIQLYLYNQRSSPGGRFKPIRRFRLTDSQTVEGVRHPAIFSGS